MPAKNAATPTVEHFVSAGTSIPVDVFLPAAAGRHPACVILYGTFGLLPKYRDDILSFGEALAEKNVVALLPHYFERTGTAPGPEALLAIGQHLSSWRTTCAEALLMARDHPRVQAGRLGI